MGRGPTLGVDVVIVHKNVFFLLGVSLLPRASGSPTLLSVHIVPLSHLRKEAVFTVWELAASTLAYDSKEGAGRACGTEAHDL